MATFKKPTQVVPKSNHALAIRMFKVLLLEMGKRKMSDTDIVEFAKNPCPENFGLKPDPYSPRDTLYEQIRKFTTLEERNAVLDELATTGQI